MGEAELSSRNYRRIKSIKLARYYQTQEKSSSSIAELRTLDEERQWPIDAVLSSILATRPLPELVVVRVELQRERSSGSSAT